MNDCVGVCECRNYRSYLSIIAHMSRLTFSKAPRMPFSTACKSAGWSSTRIVCMQPWKERWEGGNSVWRKYPETNTRNKRRKLNITLSTITNQRELEMNKMNCKGRFKRHGKKGMHSSRSEREVKECGKQTNEERWALLIHTLKDIMTWKQEAKKQRFDK